MLYQHLQKDFFLEHNQQIRNVHVFCNVNLIINYLGVLFTQYVIYVILLGEISIQSEYLRISSFADYGHLATYFLEPCSVRYSCRHGSVGLGVRHDSAARGATFVRVHLAPGSVPDLV